MSDDRKKFKSAKDFRQALEARIRQDWKVHGGDYQDHTRTIAFERCLARFDPTYTTLKGGYALELRLRDSRVTKDVDLAISEQKLLIEDKQAQAQAVVEYVRDQLNTDLHDFFYFQVAQGAKIIEKNEGGGVRVSVTAKIDDRTFREFHIDVVVQEKEPFPAEQVPGRDVLRFANVPNPTFSVTSNESMFADKLHAYTRPWHNRENTRVRDIIDLNLLIEHGLDPQKLERAVREVFAADKSHKLPEKLPIPPSSWERSYPEMAKDAGLEYDLGKSFERLNTYYEKTLSHLAVDPVRDKIIVPAPEVNQTGEKYSKVEHLEQKNEIDVEHDGQTIIVGPWCTREDLHWLSIADKQGWVKFKSEDEQRLAEKWYQAAPKTLQDEYREQYIYIYIDGYVPGEWNPTAEVTKETSLTDLAILRHNADSNSVYVEEADLEKLSKWIADKNKDTILLQKQKRSITDSERLLPVERAQGREAKQYTPDSKQDELVGLFHDDYEGTVHLSEKDAERLSAWIEAREKGIEIKDTQPIVVVSEWNNVRPDDLRTREIGTTKEYTKTSDLGDLRELRRSSKTGAVFLEADKSDLLDIWIADKEKTPAEKFIEVKRDNGDSERISQETSLSKLLTLEMETNKGRVSLSREQGSLLQQWIQEKQQKRAPHTVPRKSKDTPDFDL